MGKKIGFEYQDNKKEVVFETFLRYTDEKEKSAKVLGKILRKLLVKRNLALLDVGSGNGKYLLRTLKLMNRSMKINVVLLEPSTNMLEKLKSSVNIFPDNVFIKIEPLTIELFRTNCRFDIILASHPPFSKKQFADAFQQMSKLLKSDGHLIIVLRGKDDIYEFKNTFKSKLSGSKYKSMIIDDAVKIINKINNLKPLKIFTFKTTAKLRLPVSDNMPDTISIVEFLLNKRWNKVPDDIREAIMDYINRKKGILNQIEEFVVIKNIAANKL